MNNNYSLLLNVLDTIREESLGSIYSIKYNPDASDLEKINQSRSRAYIHLYLKVGFGLLEFPEREKFITDGSQDGGIDGYFINKDERVVYFIQSKFRTSQKNFEQKEIALEEILAMDIDRVLAGELVDERGMEYSGKIKQLVREVSSIPDIARYKYKVIILANLERSSPDKIKRLVGGYEIEIFNYERCYRELVFPVVSGTFFKAAEVNISLDLSNKYAGSKISYTVATEFTEAEITVLFVPTFEVAKMMFKYKNSILIYNPRSYLELEGQKVNTDIRQTIINRNTNEFALFNNGITLLSEETSLNERIGQKNKAQLALKNPQVINGGQTAYTLNKIFEETPEELRSNLFENKEVLMKIITLDQQNGEFSDEQKLTLIDQISTATNRQTPVLSSDRKSNDVLFVKIQRLLFEEFGLLFERKRGEFHDGVSRKYIDSKQIVERNLFFRIYYAANGDFLKATQKGLFSKIEIDEEDEIFQNKDALKKFYFGYLAFIWFSREKEDSKVYTNVKRRKDVFGKIFAFTLKYYQTTIEVSSLNVENLINSFNAEWLDFLELHSKTNTKFVRSYFDKATRETRLGFSYDRWINHFTFSKDLIKYFSSSSTELPKD